MHCDILPYFGHFCGVTDCGSDFISENVLIKEDYKRQQHPKSKCCFQCKPWLGFMQQYEMVKEYEKWHW